MSQSETELWAHVDGVLEAALLRSAPDLDWVIAAGQEAGLPQIQVSPTQGRLLQLLVLALGAHRVLELGTLAGYSAIWMASALPPDGKLISLEAEPRHAEVARANVERAGLAERVEVRVGPALEELPRLLDEGQGPFDLTFIDADKVAYPEYLQWAHRLSRVGSVIIADNVVRQGAVADLQPRDESAGAVRRFLEQVGGTAGLSATAIQTVGAKGYDGFCLALVTAPAHG
ncbi:MAG: O-methyltransferase [Candidatus Dormibacteria bacterium]